MKFSYQLCSLAFCGTLMAHPGVEAPRVGKIVDTQGNLRSVVGLAGNFITDHTETPGIQAFDCSARTCVASATADLIATDGRVVVSYSSQNRTFTRSAAGRDTPEQIDWNPLLNGDEVLAMRLTQAGGEIAVRRSGAVWILSQDGAVLGAVPADADSPVLLLENGAIFVRGGTIVLRRGNGDETSFPAPLVRALYRMSSDWVEAIGNDAVYAIQITPRREALFVLPRGVE